MLIRSPTSTQQFLSGLIRSLVVSSLILFSIAATATEPSRQYVLQLKWFHQFQFAGYYAALEQGFYREEGLDVVIRGRDIKTTPIDDVLSGRADFGISDSSLILHKLNGKPVVALAAIFQNSPLVLMTMEKNNLVNPADLIGKRVMYQRDMDDALIMAMFNEMGVGAADFTYVKHTLDDNALLKGEVDAMSAYITNQPYLYRRAGHRVNIINPANYGIDFYGDTLFTSTKLIENDEQAVMAFRRASIKGWQYALEHSEEIIELIASKYNPRGDRDTLRYEADALRRMIRPRLIELGDINPARYSRIADIYKERGLAPNAANLNGLLYTDYVNKKADLQQWLQLVSVAASLIAIIAITVIVINRRLTLAVKKRTQDLHKVKEEIDHYIEIVDTYILTIKADKDFNFTYISDALCTVTGFSRKELLGKKHEMMGWRGATDETLKIMIKALHAGNHWQGELKTLTKYGHSLHVFANVDPILNTLGEFDGYTAVMIDNTDKKRIELLAITDPLTSLYNRIKTNNVLANELKRSARGKAHFSIILLDIDKFKEVNDNLGHLIGDKVLIQVADIITKRKRETDVAGRWGGEEFIILCLDTDLDGALKLAEELRISISNHHFDIGAAITCSFGVAQYCGDESGEEMIDRADKALYRAKDEGRNQVIAG
jgi:diguanylate cyclase (GGDEF)-like protein/PAS domain S-box-containing protein